MTIIEKTEWKYLYFIKHHYPYLWCKRLYRETFGESASFSNPKDINEKILWLAFFTDTTLWTTLADKYAVREYVKTRVGADILVPFLGKWEKAENIHFESLPKKFVMKPNNGSYDTVIVRDKTKINVEEIRAKMKFSLRHPFGYEGAEIHYLRMKPCIIAEQLLETSTNGGLIDYKIWCINGKFHHVLVCANRNNDTHKVDLNYYDRDWNRHPEKMSPKYRNEFDTPRPANLERMVECAEILAKGLPQARVDFYNINGKIYFGEITLTSNFGMMPYYMQDVLDEMGQLCRLPKRSLIEKCTTFFNRWLPKFY